MKKYFVCALAILATAWGSPSFATGIEMEAEVVLESPQAIKIPVKTVIQGTKVRSDMGDTSTIVNSANGEVTVLVHPQKSFAITKKEENGSGQKTGTIERTSKKSTVSGYSCEEFLETGSGTSIWVTEDARVSPEARTLLMDTQAGDDPLWAALRNAIGATAIPMRIVIASKDGNIQWTLLSLKEREIEESEFVIPASYAPMQESGEDTGDNREKAPTKKQKKEKK